MKKISKLIYHFRQLLKYQQLDTDKKRLTFYSEGKNYWSYIGPLMMEVLNHSDIPVCYISSGEDDPGLDCEHPNLSKFKIDEGFVRNWVFENLEADILVMTMPDLHQYQVKRSKHNVHYVYTQHSLVSLHMVYRPGAFDHFDTIFCAGPHHKREIRAIEALHGLPQKDLVEHGYARLDTILADAETRQKKDTSKHILIAPSWGPNGTIELGLATGLIATLLENHFQVTLRPHPMTIKFCKAIIDQIIQEHSGNERFNFEDSVDGVKSLQESDIMICDWSGAALDYAFGLGKPVLFVDVPRKVNNPDYEDIPIEPFEVSIREKIGSVIAVHNGQIDSTELIQKIEGLPKTVQTAIRDEHIYNVGNSAKIGASYIAKILGGLSGD